MSSTTWSHNAPFARLFLASVAAAPLLISCSNRCADVAALSSSASADPRIAAIGDSVLAWSADRCQSIPDHASLVLGTPVTNYAVNGAKVLSGSDEKPAIARQLDTSAAEGFDVVIVNGGGNDLNGTCECGACDDVLDDLVAKDGTAGAMVALIERITATGARVVLVDYFVLHDDAWYGFDRCGDALAELDARYETLAAGKPGVTLVDLGDVVSPTTQPEAYAFDHVHPSDDGAALMGALVAAALDAAP